MNKLTLPGFKIKPTLSINKINYLAYYHYSKDFIFDGEFHNTWELVYIDLGEAIITADATKFVLPQKSFFLHPHNQYHSIRANNCHCKVMVIAFECQYGDELLMRFCNHVNTISSEYICILSNILDEYKHFFNGKNLFDECIDSPEVSTSLNIIRNYIEIFFLSLLRNADTLPPQNNDINKNSPLVSSIILYLKNNLHTNITLDSLAKYMGYSQSYLSKCFHNSTGYSITSYLNVLRIEQAKLLLSDLSLSVQYIASQTGFSSLQYFSRTFKAKTGYSPLEYRKSIELYKRYDLENR